MRDDYMLHVRGGVGTLLARRLAASVKGSYSVGSSNDLFNCLKLDEKRNKKTKQQGQKQSSFFRKAHNIRLVIKPLQFVTMEPHDFVHQLSFRRDTMGTERLISMHKIFPRWLTNLPTILLQVNSQFLALVHCLRQEGDG